MAKRKVAGRASTKPQSTREATSHVPEKVNEKRKLIEREDEGPRSWFLEQVEASYSRLAASDVALPKIAAAVIKGVAAFKSVLRSGQGIGALIAAAPNLWQERLAEYKRRKAISAVRPIAPGAPAVPGGRNWVPLGPTVVMNGQTVGEEPIAGRIAGLAIGPNGTTVFAASACGGVFRSDNAGTSWRSLMDGFDVDPTQFASSSLACGAIAIDASTPDRIYVGTGEGDTDQLFASRVINALPAYRGIGPIRSDDGGDTWVVERTATGSEDLAGHAFFALAVNPTDGENCVAATTIGLYQRVLATNGTPTWHRRRSGRHSSVVVTRTGTTTRFFAAEWGGGVVHSTNGATWSATGTGFPTTNVGRIALGVQSNNPNLVYAFVANTKGAVLGVYRLDGVNGAWKAVASLPDVIPTDNGRGQGDYDMAIAIDPSDSNLIYLAGSYFDASPFPGSVWRCPVLTVSGQLKCVGAKSIGTHAHADVHVLAHTPGNSNELWCGCDGGVFLNRAPQTTGEFAGLNNGLSCLCCNFIAQHPTDPGVILTGLQDNGTAHTSGGPQWSHVNYGDGGYCLINWDDPTHVLSFVNGDVYRSTTGGSTHDDWTRVWNFGWATMTQPIVSTPFNSASPTDAQWVAVGAGSEVFVSKNFAGTWPMRFSLPGGTAAGNVFALAFASTDRLFIGTTVGRVFRADRSGTTWTVSRLDNIAAGPLPLQGLISDIAVDWSDAALASVYLCFGGMGDFRHVWRFDGTSWAARSGTAPAGNLLDVEHNALVVDRNDPNNIYAGADIGVWQSSDQGLTWAPLQNGLPDAPVFDLQIHATQRLLRAATHGRGVYELALP